MLGEMVQVRHGHSLSDESDSEDDKTTTADTPQGESAVVVCVSVGTSPA
jgi:hypothetical protein